MARRFLGGALLAMVVAGAAPAARAGDKAASREDAPAKPRRTVLHFGEDDIRGSLTREGPGILPTHAVIDAGATGAVLRASGSAPVHLNGQPIIAAPLRHGDLISIGDLRVMVELRANAPGQPERRPRLRLIEGDEEPHSEPDHLRPALSVVREAAQLFEEGRHADGGLHSQISEIAEIDPPASV